MEVRRLLIVDDESSLRTSLFRVFTKKGFQVITAGNRAEALSFAGGTSGMDLAIVDLRLPDGSGLELLKELKTQFPEIQVIVLTGHGTIDDAVEATRLGAFHFLTKPFNVEELSSLADKALSQHVLERENRNLKHQLRDRYSFDNIVGQSDEILAVMDLIARVADSDSTVMINGESGTGKELVARAIHFDSSRANKPLIPVNCGAIPADLLESELFGHVKGAFTGAIGNRIGRFELAHGGTIFLDEIGEMSPALQVKLLRVIQERSFEPVGSTKTVEVDVRIIAATNIDLEVAVATGRFREDLFYRLNVIPVKIPALRDRKSDIPLLLHHFVQQFNKSKNRNLQGFSPEAMDLLFNYSWPGNVRELENLVERLSILKGSGIVQVSDLPEKYQSRKFVASSQSSALIPDTGIDFNSAVDAYENALILQALEVTGWNRNQAAQLLRLNRTTLVEKIKKKGLRPPEEMVN